MYIICNSIPTGTELQFSITLASVERSRPGLIISGDRSKGQDKIRIRTKTNLVPTATGDLSRWSLLYTYRV